VMFTSDRRKMGRFANRPALAAVAWIVTIAIILLNAYLLKEIIFGGTK
jgi:manganese transport protein